MSAAVDRSPQDELALVLRELFGLDEPGAHPLVPAGLSRFLDEVGEALQDEAVASDLLGFFARYLDPEGGPPRYLPSSAHLAGVRLCWVTEDHLHAGIEGPPSHIALHLPSSKDVLHLRVRGTAGAALRLRGVEGRTCWFEAAEDGRRGPPVDEVLQALPSAWRAWLGGGPLARALTRLQRPPADRFLHRDLAGLLLPELHQALQAELPARLARDPAAAARRHRAALTLGEAIVDRLHALERARLALHEAPRPVLATDWLISLSLLPPKLRARICRCEAQVARWAEVYGPELARSEDDGLVADTALLDPALKDRLREALGGPAHAALTGVVVRGDNRDALELLRPGWANQVQVACFDPPYNTGRDFGYRDAFSPATWLTLMRDRLAPLGPLLRRDGTLVAWIDDGELHRLTELMRSLYGRELAKLVFDRNRKNDARHFSVGHEYALVFARDAAFLRKAGVRFREPREGVEEARAHFRALTRAHGEDWEAVRRGWLDWFRTIPVSDPRRRMMRFTKVGPRGPYRDDGDVSWPGGGGPRFEVRHPATGRPVRIPSRGWVYPTPDRFWEAVAEGRVVFGPDETSSPRVARYLFEGRGQVMPSVFYSYAQTAAQAFDALFGRRVFDNPKHWPDLARLIRYLGDEDAVVLDHFAGSGSTAHAVLALNREDGGRRRFLLAESGDHGDSVLLPRLQKVACTDRWEGGRPLTREPVPLLVEVIRPAEDLRASVGPPQDGALRWSLDDQGKPRLAVGVVMDPWGATMGTREGPVVVDLVQTVNLALGLRLEGFARPAPGLLRIRGTTPGGEAVLVIWRDALAWPSERLREAWPELLGGAPPDRVWVNGPSPLPEGAEPVERLLGPI